MISDELQVQISLAASNVCTITISPLLTHNHFNGHFAGASGSTMVSWKSPRRAYGIIC